MMILLNWPVCNPEQWEKTDKEDPVKQLESFIRQEWEIINFKSTLYKYYIRVPVTFVFACIWNIEHGSHGTGPGSECLFELTVLMFGKSQRSVNPS